ncbi:glutamate 5-kinase [Ilumatobacter sp.]|uniref:glutamate 5-kinase n=1 Tax=Ilumatobacter sp. TaxID=1967498 RepID=UPI003B51DDC0
MRVVAKIGTASVTDDDGMIDSSAIAKLCDEVAALRAEGHDVVVVSSGAVAAGVAALGMAERPTDMTTLQAVSAAGQSRLVQAYDIELARHGLVGAQLLVDSMDFVGRVQYLHLRTTLERLLELGCVPIVNENDAIANDELRYGDNDRIAALIANSVRADVLVLLTDMDGVFTSDPRRDPSATLVPLVRADDPLLAISAESGGSGRGSGGMASKLTAARMASWSGVRGVIARAARRGVLAGAVSDELVGTTFEAHPRGLSARKLWIAFAAEVAGSVDVDAGARRAVTEHGGSLLPAGVVGVRGTFEPGDVIDLRGPDGEVFARGLTSLDSASVGEVRGRRTSDLPPGTHHEVIHRDGLVVLSRPSLPS